MKKKIMTLVSLLLASCMIFSGCGSGSSGDGGKDDLIVAVAARCV